MPVDSLSLSGLGPFQEVDFDFDLHVNVLVGPNNSGKTTVLLALADLLLYPFSLPRKLIRERSQFTVTFTDTHRRLHRLNGRLPISSTKVPAHATPSERAQIRLWAPWTSAAITKLQSDVDGLGFRAYVPAMRLSTDYRSGGPQKHKPQDTNEVVSSLVRLRARGHEGKRVTPSAFWTDDTRVIQRMIDLDYRAYRESKPAVRAVIDKIARIASEIPEGFPLESLGIGEDEQGLFPRFRTPDGNVPLSVLSQGTQSIILWCAELATGYAQYYDFAEDYFAKPGVLIIDEIDAHLHPSWQRRVLHALIDHFPGLQVFCTSHSPMVLAGLRAGQIHLLSRTVKGKVYASRNISDISGWSADEIYSTFMGIEPTDADTADKLEQLRHMRQRAKLSPTDRKKLLRLRKTVGKRLTGGSVIPEAEILATEMRRVTKAFARHQAQATNKKGRRRAKK